MPRTSVGIAVTALIASSAVATDVVVTGSSREVSVSVQTSGDGGCVDQDSGDMSTGSEGFFDEAVLRIAECPGDPTARATAVAIQDSIVSSTLMEVSGQINTLAVAPCDKDTTNIANAVANVVYDVQFTVVAPVEIAWEVTLTASDLDESVFFAIDGTDVTILDIPTADGTTHVGVATLEPDDYILHLGAAGVQTASCERDVFFEATFDARVTLKLPADCPGDIDGDGAVSFVDLLALLTAWGPCPGCPEDINGDDVVAFADLLAVLTGWGACP